MLPGVLSIWAQKYPDAVAAYVAALASGEMKELAVAAITRELAGSDPQMALSWIEKLPDETVRQGALEPLVSQWSESDPQAAAKFALENSTGDQRQICWRVFLSNGRRPIPQPHLPGRKVCPMQLAAKR